MDKKLQKYVYVFLFFLSVLRKLIVGTSTSNISLTKDGDIMFGMLIPVYRKDFNQDCTLYNKDSLLWIRAINYAMDELRNYQIPSLQNTSFGFSIKDTCEKPALEQALQLVHTSQTKGPQNSSKRTLAVLSSHYERDSSTLLSLFKIPNMIVSDLNALEVGLNPKEHSYNFESLKMSFYRAKSVVGLLNHFHWDSVFVVVDKQYKKEYSMFQNLAGKSGICIAGVFKSMENMEINIRRSLGIRTILLFTDGLSMIRSLKDVQTMRPSHYTWIDVIGIAQSMTSEFMMTGETILSLRPEFKFLSELRRYINPDCDKHSKRSSELCKVDRASLSAMVELDDLLSKSSISNQFKTAQDRTNDIQGVVNGVFTVANAVALHVEKHCWEKNKDECLAFISSQDVASELEFLTKNEFLESTNHHKPFLKENIFSLISFQGNLSEPREVGTWEKTWFINHAAIRWPGKVPKAPVSTCSPACPAGYVQVNEEGRKCCWSCEACNYNQYIVDNNTCMDCVRGYWPSSDFRTCEFKIQITIMSCAVAISSVAAVLYSLVL